SVLFGRLGTGGVPVYGVSADTPAPITSGTVDVGKVFGDSDAAGLEQNRLNESFPLVDPVRRWVAPYTGTVRIVGPLSLSSSTLAARLASTTADGVRVSVQKNGTELFSVVIPKGDSDNHPIDIPGVSVTRGDRIYFRVNSINDGSLDEVTWGPQIIYSGISSTRDVNNLPPNIYTVADFTLGGRETQVKAPLTGTLHLSGNLDKRFVASSDDLKIVVTRDGVEAFSQTVAGSVTGSVPVSADIAVQQGQTLKWRLAIDSPIDLGTILWTPKATYTAVQGIDRVVDGDGNPLFSFFPAYDVDMYPVDNLTAPQQSFTVPTTGPFTVRPALGFNNQASGRVVLTVKKRQQLVAKKVLFISNGSVSDPQLTFNATEGDVLFFDISASDPTLAQHVTSLVMDSDQVGPVPAAFHGAAPPEGGFPQSYRGWSVIGYNGNKTRATQPIVEADLVIDDGYADQFPDSVDPDDPAQKDAFEDNPQVTAPKAFALVPAPEKQRWMAGPNVYVSSGRSSSSRLGSKSVALPGGGALTDATAVPRISKSRTLSATGGVGVPGGSVGVGVGTGDST
ncbi:hypothetical protein ACIBBG_34385, partial [Micromonospora chersina]